MKFQKGEFVKRKGHSTKPLQVKGYNGLGMVILDTNGAETPFNRKVFLGEELYRPNSDSVYEGKGKVKVSEIERAEAYAEKIIEGFKREMSPLYKMFTFDYDLACEEALFQELVIQQIRNRGYLVKRRIDDDGLNLLLQNEINGSETK